MAAAATSTPLKLTVAGASSETNVIGAGASETTASFKDVPIEKTGYYSFILEGLKKSGTSFGDIKALRITGTAVVEAHFNLKERHERRFSWFTSSIPYRSLTDPASPGFINEVTWSVKRSDLVLLRHGVRFSQGIRVGIQR